MSEYKPQEIEKKWQKIWKDNQTFKTENQSNKPKYFVLDMFPYPSGAGLHVGHPLGYIATDIVARYKRLKGFNVLHPMGYDSFGLPAEQYAIQTGQHPAITTENNISRYHEQLDNIGFSYDWSREVRTSDPSYYKWTQWIFIKFFDHWYNKASDRAEPMEALIALFEKEGNKNIKAVCDEGTPFFSTEEWNAFSETEKHKITLSYRLAYLSNTFVNWCPALGTVLANEEVKDGVSERGGYPVVRKEMPQWSLRITAYAERLINDLDTVDWPESIKEQQRYWIGKSRGCMLNFKIQHAESVISVFTTRVDTIYGVTYLTLAPEHELVGTITTPGQKEKVEKYVAYAKNKSERDRQADVKTVTGEFTGAYAINPLNGALIPVWIGEYVLAGYGTGAVMAVPSSDTRDYAFANHFDLPIIAVQEGPKTDISMDDFDPKAGTMINSDFLNGMTVKQALEAMTRKVEELGVGYGKVNYKIRDAIFSRQRYWGEPIPVYYKDGLPYVLNESDLPLELPSVDEYKPTESGEPPLARAKDWTASPQPLSDGEGLKDTMGWATADPMIWNILKKHSRANRKEQTQAEEILWQELRNSKTGHKIRRQHAIKTYIADFICLRSKTIIEVDGGYHADKEQIELDKQRTQILNDFGFQVLRFTNEEVIKNKESVIEQIKKALSEEEGSGEAFPLETNTMPGWAGSSWYFFRYMDPQNEKEFASKEALDYWQEVDLYLGGSEHATGHLLYSRFWTKFLYDLGYVKTKEYAKKLINQGMIQGRSNFAYKLTMTNIFISNGWKEKLKNIQSKEELLDLANEFNKQLGRKEFIEKGDDLPKENKNKYLPSHLSIIESSKYNGGIYVDVNIVENEILDIQKFRQSREEFKNAEFILEDGKYICGFEVEKMSKSKLNVVNPDDVVEKYGADTLRLYEMFLGPLEMSKPWNTNSISGVSRFLRNVWKLFYDDKGAWLVTDEPPTKEELKALHKTIKKVEEDIERFSFNTSVSTFMVCVNELSDLKSHKRAILQDLLIVLAPYAPHIAEELWSQLGNKETITYAPFPAYKEEYTRESSFEYPISVNGKVRHKMVFSLDADTKEVESQAIASAEIQKWLEGKAPKKVIVVPNKIVNVVV